MTAIDVRFQCPACGGDTAKALYLALPLGFCLDEACGTAWGLGATVMGLLGFNGRIAVYEGSYWRALWQYLRGK